MAEPLKRGNPISVEVEIRLRFPDGVTERRAWSCSQLNWNETKEQVVINGTKLGVQVQAQSVPKEGDIVYTAKKPEGGSN